MADPGKAWLWELYQDTRATSRESLHSYFRGQSRKHDLTAEIMNMVSGAVKAVWPADGLNSTSCNLGAEHDQDIIVDKQHCATYLYRQVAEHLLQRQFPPQQQQQPEADAAATKRFKGLIRAIHNPDCYELVMSQEFHMPLIECALHVVAFVTEGPEQHYPRAAEVLQRTGYSPALWWAIECFLDCFGVNSRFPMPSDVQQHLEHIQTRLLDCSVFNLNSLLFNVLKTGGGGMYKDGDNGLAVDVVRAYAEQAVQRVQLVGWGLQQAQTDSTCQQTSQHQLALPENFPDQCAWLMDKVLINHLDVCFGQHMSVMVACVAYVAAKLTQTNVTFKRVTEMTLLWASNTGPEVFQQAEIQPATSTAAAQYGDIRMFYNTRFLPAIEAHVRDYMQEYQQMLAAKKAAAAMVAAEEAGQSFTSPSKAAGPMQETPGKPDRQPLAGLTLNAMTQGVAAGALPSKALARTKGGKAATVSEECVMKDAAVVDAENVAPIAAGGLRGMLGFASQPGRAAGGITPSRLMR